MVVRRGRQLGENLDVPDVPARMAGLAATIEAELSSRFSTSFSIVELDATKECHEVGDLMDCAYWKSKALALAPRAMPLTRDPGQSGILYL